MGCIGTIAALGTAVVLASAGDDALTIGSEASFPPYLVTEADGSLTGFDREVMDEVCTRIDRTCDWQIVTFEELIPGVMEGRFDVVLGGMAITPERRLLVEFSQPYSEGGGLDWFAGFAGAPEPAMATVAVEAGTIHEAYVRDQGLRFRSYPSELDALEAVSLGQTDLSFGPYDDRPDLDGAIFGKGLDLLWSVEIPDDGVGIAVCKGNTDLLAELDGALDAMWADGTLDALNSRWFEG